MKKKSNHKKKGEREKGRKIKEEIEKIESSELEEELLSEKLSEIAEKIKQKEAEQEIGDTEFHTFMKSLEETSPPVLERIARSTGQIDFGQGIAETPKPEESRERNIGNYVTAQPNYFASTSSKNSDQEQVKYDAPISAPVLKPRERFELRRPQFTDQTTARRPAQKDVEEIFRPEFVDIKEPLPFEKREKKYREFRPQ